MGTFKPSQRQARRFRNGQAFLGCTMVALLATAAAGCGSSSGLPVIVRIVGNPLGNPDSAYKPADLTIHVGQTVKWVDKDDLEHTVTPEMAYKGWSGGSSLLHHGQSYSVTFTRPGVYRYQCMVHWNMLGLVRVIQPGGST